jgi:predicted MFS family arabinose efflux permease
MSERKILFLLGAVQFINVVDFMMVLPLGPDFASALGISTAQLGLVAGSYTLAAGAAGLIGSLFLDRFDRRKALFFVMMGLVVGTAAGGLARGLGSMLAARVLAGMFGGPASALALAIIADVVPPERRGKAMGAVAGAFAVASVVGVPAGLELAHWGGWRAPFFTVAALGLLVAAGAIALMPPMRKHLDAGGRPLPTRPLRAFLVDPIVLMALATTAVLMMSTFSLISNLSAFLQFNLGFPRAHLEYLYMAGGVVSFFAMRVAGGQIDRRGAVTVASFGTVLALLGTVALFMVGRPPVPIVVLFAGLMVSNAVRVVSLNTLASRVPAPQERARFMSAQSAVQHIATSIGAIASTWVLVERPDRSLGGIPRLGAASLVLAGVMPLLLAAVARRLRVRDSAA